jgi:oxygen-independent coproporphyrinogen-3 oxidase
VIIQRPFGLYLHIPFCARKCGYCDFFSVEGTHAAEAYVEAMEREIAAIAAGLSTKCADTLFVGGGTPSLLPLPLLARLINRIRRNFDLSLCTEWTLECNPGTLTPEKAHAYRDLGFNRVSLGAQSFQDAELKFLNRIHDADQIRQSVGMLEKAGFDNFNLDLMFGIPGQTIHHLVTNLKTAISLGASHVSLYGLTVEEGTAFHERLLQGEFTRINEEIYEAQFLTAHAHLSAAGFVHYEVSNFAKTGREALHNLNVWRGRDYFGFGVSAHSRAGVCEWANGADLAAYIKDPLKKSFQDVLADDQMRLERLMLGLRTNEGVPAALCGSRANINRLKQRQLLRETDGRVILTAEGMLLLDEIVLLLEGRKCLTLN